MPSWARAPALEPGQVRLDLDPGLAFGTGGHATTAMCLDWLAGEPLDGLEVVDYGCGSGILALAAAKLGARRVWAVDNDPQALEATRRNALANGVDAPVTVCGPSELPTLRADISRRGSAGHSGPGARPGRPSSGTAGRCRSRSAIPWKADTLYTRCPHCMTVFVVAAEQLKAAHGNVRCGTCLESFDAIPHLSDGPVQTTSTPEETGIATASTPAPPPAAAMESDLEVEAEIDFAGGLRDEAQAPPESPGDGPGDPRSAAEQLSSTLDAVRAAASVDEATAASPPREDREEPDRDVGPASEKTGSDTARRVSVLDEPVPAVDAPLEEAVPEVLREEMEDLAASSAARRRNVGYGAAALALLVLLAGQYVFFMPEDAARRYPQWRGAIETMCIRVGCVLPERRDPGRIRVVSRDVRVHPKIEGVMQIKATLTNSAPYRRTE